MPSKEVQLASHLANSERPTIAREMNCQAQHKSELAPDCCQSKPLLPVQSFGSTAKDWQQKTGSHEISAETVSGGR